MDVMARSSLPKITPNFKAQFKDALRALVKPFAHVYLMGHFPPFHDRAARTNSAARRPPYYRANGQSRQGNGTRRNGPKKLQVGGATTFLVTHNPEFGIRAKREVHIVDGQAIGLVAGPCRVTCASL
jgi:hypothetical protein